MNVNMTDKQFADLWKEDSDRFVSIFVDSVNIYLNEEINSLSNVKEANCAQYTMANNGVLGTGIICSIMFQDDSFESVYLVISEDMSPPTVDGLISRMQELYDELIKLVS